MPSGAVDSKPVRIATRASALARWQADTVAAALTAADPEVSTEICLLSTIGDRRLDAPLWQIGGKGVFVKEVQAALLDGRADIAVHSAKDLPARTPDELEIVAVPQRGNPSDALVGGRFADLGPGARIATGSARRRAQLAHARPDLTFRELRGNIETRLGNAVDGVAVVVAAAALDRLGIEPAVVDVLPHELMLPQVGQGILAVECRADDVVTRQRLAAIDHGPTRRILEAERAFLDELGGDCDLPVGAHATLVGVDESEIRMEALVASLDGHVVLRELRTGADGTSLGRSLARYLLDDCGGRALLDR